MGDYASISLVNAQLFQALEARAHSLQEVAEQAKAGELKKDETIKQVKDNLGQPLTDAIKNINSLLTGETDRLKSSQKDTLNYALDNLQEILNSIESLEASKSKE